jgi:hypothetical protein
VKATAALGAERYNVPVGSGAAVLLLDGLPPWLEMMCYKPADLVSGASCKHTLYPVDARLAALTCSVWCCCLASVNLEHSMQSCRRQSG